MHRQRYDDYDDEFDEHESSGEYHFDDPEELEEEDEEDLGEIPAPEHSTGEQDVEISMEIDEDGNEVWRAEDSQVPGSTSKGHSVEEAMEGVDDRRRQYREMLRKSREERKRRKDRGE
jgi:hypothetical protein